MFNNTVTQTYNLQDATFEILIMLAGAFLLGCVVTWLLLKLFRKDKQTESIASPVVKTVDNTKTDIQPISKEVDTVTTSIKKPISTKKVETLTSSVQATTGYSTPKIDDLTKVSGITTVVEDELRDRGIKSYTDLRDSSKQTIVDTLDSIKEPSITVSEAQTWPHQASLAAKGEWEKLSEYQLFMERNKQAAKEIKNQAPIGKIKDDLKIIEGIGPKIEDILNTNGIRSFKDLRSSDRDTLKMYLDNAGSRFKMHEPQSWPHQASMAEKGKWEELKIYQEFMDGGREIPSASAFANIDIPVQPVIDDIETEFNQALEKDDLKKVEGIGPKIEEILNKKGITTFAKLGKTDRDTLKGYLDEAGNQFKIHEPGSWPHQATLAASGEWAELSIYQEFMSGGRDDIPSVTTKTSSRKTPLENKENTKNKQDDLKRIDGIGPKIQELLNNVGIKTFKDLANTKSDTIQALLDEAGPQFRVHEPESWPIQAKMASEEEWVKLDSYNENLHATRNKNSKKDT